MDSTLRTLLIEVSRTVLRVLDAPEDAAKPPESKRRPGVVAALNDTLGGFVVQTDLAIAPAQERASAERVRAWNGAERGDQVRVWTGSMYATGEVISVCRGTPKKIKVRIPRAGKRGKVVVVDADKAQIVKLHQKGES